jgi:hypothetical protein
LFDDFFQDKTSLQKERQRPHKGDSKEQVYWLHYVLAQSIFWLAQQRQREWL